MPKQINDIENSLIIMQRLKWDKTLLRHVCIYPIKYKNKEEIYIHTLY